MILRNVSAVSLDYRVLYSSHGQCCEKLKSKLQNNVCNIKTTGYLVPTCNICKLIIDYICQILNITFSLALSNMAELLYALVLHSALRTQSFLTTE
jgi:hypothetical protein